MCSFIQNVQFWLHFVHFSIIIVHNSKQSLKCLLNNGNKYGSTNCSLNQTERTSVDLKVVNFLLDQQNSHTKYPCFFFLWDSRDETPHWVIKEWAKRENMDIEVWVWYSFFGRSPWPHGNRQQHTGKMTSSRPSLQPSWNSGHATLGRDQDISWCHRHTSVKCSWPQHIDP